MKLDKVAWVDTLKVVGILAVILGHIATPLSSFIYTWHMPLFFMVSGFFLNIDTSINSYLKKQFPRIFIPYFSFALIALVVESVKRYGLNRPALELLDSLIGIFVWMDFDALSGSYAFVLWFLPALFFARLFVFLLMKSIQQMWLVSFILLIIFALSFYIQLPFAIDEAMNAAIFVLVGYWAYRLDYNVWLIALLWFGVCFYFGFSSLDMASKDYENIPVNMISAISFCMILITIIKRFYFHHALLALWGGNTMLLFILHPYTNNVASILSGKWALGYWWVTFLCSLSILYAFLLIKKRINHWKLVRYV